MQANPNNIWQVGKPNKAVFDSAYSFPNAIMTDTLQPYPVNDTSVFVLKHNKLLNPNTRFGLRFQYQLDIDSGELATIEVSGDSGLHWVNVMTSDTLYDFGWIPEKPRLDTSTSGWQEFYLSMTSWCTGDSVHHPYPSYITADTFLIRFTFISDSVQTNRDGWIMDDFLLDDGFSNIELIENNNLVSIFPNPSNGDIYLKQNHNEIGTPEITIYDLNGKEVYRSVFKTRLELSLPDGVYMLQYKTEDSYALKRLIIKK